MGQRFVRVGFGQEGTIDADRSYHYSVNTSCMHAYLRHGDWIVQTCLDVLEFKFPARVPAGTRTSLIR